MKHPSIVPSMKGECRHVLKVEICPFSADFFPVIVKYNASLIE